MTLSIPFYCYSDKDFNIPISFDYASNGCVPNCAAGILGPNWTMRVGGIITREVRGIPDDMYVCYSGDHRINDNYGFLSIWKRVYDNGQDFPCGHFYIDNITSTGLGASEPPLKYSAWEYIHDCEFYDFSNDTGYDAESDIYHFNVDGYSGKFYLARGGKIYIYDSNVNNKLLKIDIDYDETYLSINSFSITSPTGVKYIFSTTTSSQDDRTTWYLSNIVSPNGRMANFEYEQRTIDTAIPYETYSDYITCRRSSPGSEDNIYSSGLSSGLSFPRKEECLLRSITIDNTIISFSYVNKYEKMFASNQPTSEKNANYDVYNLAVSKLTKRLVGINVVTNFEPIKNCTLSYSPGNNPLGVKYNSNVSFLDNIYISGEGTYSMVYTNKDYPIYGTFHTDHWGFYNGGGEGWSSHFNYISVLDSALNETIIEGARNPKSSYAINGMLTQITYPTGGKSVFDYEPHSYSARIDRKSPSFIPELTTLTWNQICGGLRIKSIVNYDINDSILSTKLYEYKNNNNLSSGILLNMPRYSSPYYLDLNGIPRCLWSNQLCKYGETHIEYSDVLVKTSNMQTVKYSYTTCHEYMDDIWYDFEYPFFNTGLPISGMTYDMQGTIEVINMLPLSRQKLRGSLKKETYYDSNNNIVGSVEYDLAPNIPIEEIYDNNYWQYYSMNDNLYKIPIYPGYMQTSMVKRNIPADYSEESYNYNEYGMITKLQKKVGSQIHIKRFKYNADSDSSICVQMKNNNILDKCIEENSFVYEGGNERLISSIKTDYSRSNNSHLFCISAVHKKKLIEDSFQTVRYKNDMYGNVIETCDELGMYTSYIWGYGGKYLVASIQNCQISNISHIPSLTNISSAPLENGMDLSTQQLLSIRNNTLSTFYDYYPFGGLRSKTYSNGYVETYEYDENKKLKYIKTSEGKIIKKYSYNIQHPE